jgi:hypothetical protein
MTRVPGGWHIPADTYIGKWPKAAREGVGANAASLGLMRTRGMSLFVGGVVIGLAGLLGACASLGDSKPTSADSAPGGGSSGSAPDPSNSSDKGGAAAPGDLSAHDNAVIIAHAAGIPSFRLCFESSEDLLPQPDSKTMPEANVVGVEVGSAVRIDPLPQKVAGTASGKPGGGPGKIFLYDEALIRPLYAPNAGTPPTCANLLTSSSRSGDAVLLGTVDDDLSTGVHLLAVTGCPKSNAAITYTKSQCGADYDPAVGNLVVRHIPLPGFQRNGTNALPTQVVHLSAPLDVARGTNDVHVTFGDLGSDVGATDVAASPELGLYSGAIPSSPVALPYAPDNTAAYASVGFRVTVDGTTTPLLEQSLATVQRLSSPTDVPPSYFAQASNYVLLLLGDPSPPKLPDSGPDPDERKNLHFLAVPVVLPHADGGGVDAGTPGDGG